MRVSIGSDSYSGIDRRTQGETHMTASAQWKRSAPKSVAQRKIIVYIATSADGYIARPDGDVEWLNRRPSTVDYGMTEFYPAIDTILWGRKTYDWALAYYRKKGRKSGMFDTKLANYVFSRKPPKRAAPGVEFVSEPVKAFAQRLRATPRKHIWMM